jgi:hypothetical protein
MWIHGSSKEIAVYKREHISMKAGLRMIAPEIAGRDLLHELQANDCTCPKHQANDSWLGLDVKMHQSALAKHIRVHGPVFFESLVARSRAVRPVLRRNLQLIGLSSGRQEEMHAKWKCSLAGHFQRSEGLGTSTKSRCFDYVTAKSFSEESAALGSVQCQWT